MKRTFAVIGFSWILALLVSAYLELNIVLILLILSVLGGAATLFVPALRKGKAVPAALFAAAVAFTSFCLFEQYQYQPVAALQGNSADITGYITDLPTVTASEKYRYVVQVTSVDLEGAPQEFTVVITSSYELIADVYDTITANVTFHKPYETSLLNYKSKGIYLSASVNDDSLYTQTAKSRPFYYNIISMRRSIVQTNRSMLSADAAELINGVLLGEDDLIDSSIKQDFRDSGIAHLLAVSGTHMVIMTGFMMLLLSKLRLKEWMKNLLACAFVLFFMALTGFTPSVVRSGIMTITVLMGRVVRRQSDPLNSLGIAAVALTVFNPFGAASVSLLMSFSATLGIIVMSGKLEGKLRSLIPDIKYVGNALGKTTGTVSQSVSASVFNLPVTILAFGRVSLIAPATNLFTMLPASGMLLCGGISAVFSFLGPLSFLSYPFALLAGLLAKYLIWAANFFASFPFSVLNTTDGYFTLWLCGAFLLIAAALLIRKNASLMKTASLLCVILLFAGMISNQFLMHNVTSVAVIGAEGGSSVVISQNGRAAIISCGGSWNIGWKTVNYLRENGIRAVDLLVLPSLDADYASNAGDLLAEYDIPIILMPEEDSYYSRVVSALADEDCIYPYFSSELTLWNSTTFEIVTQEAESVILIGCGGTTALYATENAAMTDFAAAPVSAAIYHTGLPGNYHKTTVPLALVTGSAQSAASALVRLQAMETAVFSAADNTMVLLTRGQGDVMLRRDG